MSFDVDAMRAYFDPHWQLVARVYEQIVQHPELGAPPLGLDGSSATAQRLELWRRIVMQVRLGMTASNAAFLRADGSLRMAEARAATGALRTLYPPAFYAYGLHIMFANVCESLGTHALHSRFFRSSAAVQSLEVFGCFALTELTHGTNVSGLRTEARYDRTCDHFVLHTPRNERGTPVGAKWWIGNAGKHATHAVVGAMLVMPGSDGASVSHGLHFFVVQLRDTRTLETLPGVTVGDIGPKPGYWDHLDNGFIVFDHVSLPRAALLNRFQDVDSTGKYIVHVDPKQRFGLTLGALSNGRVFIVGQAVQALREVMIIAVRYSASRLQFGPPSQAPREVPIMDYPLQQARLLPFLAGAYMLQFFTRWLTQTYDSFVLLPAPSEAQNAEIHALSCGAKPFATWYTARAIAETRLACGGHGFSAYAGIEVLRNSHEPSQTYEGDNNVLLQQLQRWTMEHVAAGDSSSPYGTVEAVAARASAWNDALEWSDNLEDAFRFRVHYMVQDARQVLTEAMMNADPAVPKRDEAFRVWNQCQPSSLQALSKAVIECVVFVRANEFVAAAPPALQPTLTLLRNLFGLQLLLADIGTWLEGGFCTAEHSRMLRRQLAPLCSAIKPHCCRLVDAYAPPDYAVSSALGKSDGRYEDHLWAHVRDKTERAQYWREARTPVLVSNADDMVAKAMSKL